MSSIAIAGSSGFIGKKLTKSLIAEGYQVHRLVRKLSDLKNNDIYYNPLEKIINLERLENLDAIINLAGDNIASGYWNKEKKEAIYNSRVGTTNFLSETINKLTNPPKTFISFSAIGYYADNNKEIIDEESKAGNSFLAQVCRDWEDAANKASLKTRVINARVALVLSPEGGGLKSMLLPFRLGLGGKLGSGKQIMSWISLEDLISATIFCLNNKNIIGPVNFSSPQAVSNKDFTKALAASLNRPAFFSLPAFLLKLFLGEMARELLLCSANVIPKKLTEHNFIFSHKNIQDVFKTFSSYTNSN